MGKVISITGTPEGPDSMFLGINLALSLAAQSKGKVALLDFGFAGYDTAELMLNFKIDKSILDILPVLSNADANILQGYLPVYSSQIALLKGIQEERKSEIKPINIGSIVHLISTAYPYTIAVAPVRHDEYSASLFETSNLIILTYLPHIVSLGRAKTFLNTFKSWHFPFSMVKPVQYTPVSKHGIEKSKIEECLGMSIFFELPYEPESVCASINNGNPSVLSDPHGDFSLQIKKLAKQLLDSRVYPCIENSQSEHPQADSGLLSPGTMETGIQAKSLIVLKEKIHSLLISELNSENVDLNNLNNTKKLEEVREIARTTIQELLAKEDNGLSREERAQFVNELLDDVLGLGCLEQLLKDPSITEIMVNGRDTIYVEKKGKITLTGLRFNSDTQLMTIIDRIVSPLGRRVDESSPLVDARLGDGSRVNIIIPPLALNGPVITIRKFSNKKLTADDLVGFGALKHSMAEFLRICVQLRKNIVVSGGTGSGKTTLLNIVSSFIPEDERICTIEDSAELKLPQEHVVRLESRTASLEGTGEIPIRRLVINALRMRPDRIVVGECRGGETLDMLQAMNTGHDGSLTTIHANTPKDGVARITTMVMMAGMDLPEKAIREQIASAVHVIVQLSRLSDGSRKVVEISEVRGRNDNTIDIIPIFKYEQSGIRDSKVVGEFTATGNTPSFIDEIETHGLALDRNIFTKGEVA